MKRPSRYSIQTNSHRYPTRKWRKERKSILKDHIVLLGCTIQLSSNRYRHTSNQTTKKKDTSPLAVKEWSNEIREWKTVTNSKNHSKKKRILEIGKVDIKSQKILIIVLRLYELWFIVWKREKKYSISREGIYSLEENESTIHWYMYRSNEVREKHSESVSNLPIRWSNKEISRNGKRTKIKYSLDHITRKGGQIKSLVVVLVRFHRLWRRGWFLIEGNELL